MIHECGDGRRSSAPFAARDKDVFERGPHAKNTLFIGGIPPDRIRKGTPSITTTEFMLPAGPAMHLDAKNAMWLGQGNPRYVARLFTIVDDHALLVIDRVTGSKGNPVEARAYTRKDATFGDNHVLLQGDFETARLTFAADQPAVLRRAAALIIDGNREPPTMMRWQSRDNVKNITMATLLSRGDAPVDLQVTSDEQTVTVKIEGNDWAREIFLTTELKPIAK
jgi:hypothetical protein